MKKFFQSTLFYVLITILGCTSPNGEESTYFLRNKGIHLIPNHGAENIPISVFRESDGYHMLYSTGSKEWGHLISPNMIHWTMENAIEVPSNDMGDIVSIKSEDDTTSKWVMFYYEDYVKAYISSNKIKWENHELSIDANGVPKVNKGFGKDWIMTVTNDKTLAFYRSSDLKTWSMYNEVANEFDADYAEIAIIQDIPFLMINGYETQIEMRFEKDEFKLSTNKSVRPNRSKGTFFQLDGTSYVIYSVENKVFSTPLEVTLGEENKLLLSLSGLLKNQVLVKRRGRLNKLIGDNMCTWFHFKIDSINHSSEIIITSKNNEKIKLTVTRDGSSYEIRSEGKSTELINGPNNEILSLDIIVDYHYIGIFVDDKVNMSGLLKGETIPNKILVKVDQQEVNPRSTVYTISDKPY